MSLRSAKVGFLGLSASIVLSGCLGSFGFEAKQGPDEPPAPKPPIGNNTPDKPTPVDDGVLALRSPLKRITPLQYKHAIRDMFEGRLEAGLFDDINLESANSGYSTQAQANVITGRGVSQLFYASEQVALQSVDVMPELLPCAAASPDAACVQTFLDGPITRAFRRPLLDEERALFVEVFDAARADGFDFAESVALILQTALQMPQFMYVIERGEGEDANGLIRLSQYEIAQRLGFLFLDSLPDEELLRAAGAGELSSPEQIEAQARRLLNDYPDASVTSRLIREWLHLSDELKKDASFEGFDEDMADAYQKELELAFGHALRNGGTLQELLEMKTAPINARLATFYGIEGFEPGPDGWAMAPLPERYQGLLVRPYFLASHASTSEASHVKRGYTVLKQLLCTETGSPDPALLAMVPVYPERSTSRQKSDRLRQENACAACHNQIDPIGLSFEHYDAVGAWRDRSPANQGDQVLDVAGEVFNGYGLLNTDVAGETFEGVAGLTQVLLGSETVAECVPRHWFRYAMGRREAGLADHKTIEQIIAKTTELGGTLEDLLVSITQTEAFVTRRVDASTTQEESP